MSTFSQMIEDAVAESRRIIEQPKPQRRLHWAEADIKSRQDKIAHLSSELDKIDKSDIWSDVGRKRARAPLVRELAAAQDVSPTLARLESEFEQLQIKHNTIVNDLRLSDPLNNAAAGGVQNAISELETIAQQSRNFQEFQAAYEQSQDPFVRRAYQLKGPAIASQRWPGTPQIGSFTKQVEADRRSAYTNDESRAVLDLAKSSYQGIKQLMLFSRRQYRSDTGAAGFETTNGPNSPMVRSERLQTSAANYIAAYDPSHFARGGFDGGYYDASTE